MKKYLFFAAVALVALASCSSDDLVGENSNSPNPNPAPGSGEKAIVFNSGTSAITRSSFIGKDAATLLNNQFVFAGTKQNGSTVPTTFVYDQYYANWADNTANSTESNSNNWEYVGYTPATTSLLPAGATQTIKYWDYSTTQYDFAAYSLGTGSATATAINVGDKSYTLTGTADQLKKCYISDLVTAYNQSSVSDYGKVVNFSFRSLAAKVRLAFFETIPGYSVKEVKFYNKAEFTPATGEFGTDGTSDAVPTLLTANDAKTMPTGTGTMTITFPTTGFNQRPGSATPATDYNKAHIAFAADNAASDLSATMTFGTSLADFATEREGVLDPSGNYLGRASNTATYAGGLDSETGQGKYYTVLPNEDPANLMIRIKYTLVSTDGSNEEITVDNASAVIPAELAKWSPNYAYTYIFKISDMTNGSTGTDGSDNIVCGLTPITLNAVVVDSEDGVQETITTVSHPSITTYSEGKVVTENNEYNTGAPIYIIVNNGTGNITLTTSNAKLYTVVATAAIQSISEESVDNALRYGRISTTTTTDDTYTVTDAQSGTLVVTDVTPADNLGDPDTGVDWLVKKILAADSPTGNLIELSSSENKAAKFTPTSTGTYVFQYLVSGSTETSMTAVEPAKLANGSPFYTLTIATSTANGSETYSGLYFKKDGDKYVTMKALPTSGSNYYSITPASVPGDGTQNVIAENGAPKYYTRAETYERVQSSSLANGKTYYLSSNPTLPGDEFVADGTSDPDPKTTAIYEKVIAYTPVAYKQLDPNTYYTTNRGAGKFVVTADDVVYVDAVNKYYTGSLSNKVYQYKIIKVQ